MFIYVFIFVCISLLYWLNEKRVDNKVFFLFVALIVCVAGFRDMIGGFDVYIYGEVYEIDNIRMFLYPNFEFGFKLYYWVLKLFSEKREFLFFVSSLVFLGGHAYIIKKWSPFVYLSLFIYFSKFFLYSFVYVRQGIALFIAWYAIRYLVSKQYLVFGLFLVFIFFFHKSGLIYAPILLVAHWKLSGWKLGLLTAIVLVVGISPIGSAVFSLLASQTENRKLLLYSDQVSGINFFYLLEVFLIIILALVYRKNFYKEIYSTVIFNGLVLYIFVILISLTNATFIRLGWYYYIFMVLALGCIYGYIKDVKLRLAYKMLIFLYFSLSYFRQLTLLTAGDLVPYKTIFETWDRNGDSEHYEYRNE